MRQSFARITGTPPSLRFSFVGNPLGPPSDTFFQIAVTPSLHTGPLGPHYGNGFNEVDDAFYATQQRDWAWDSNGAFPGLVGIAYSTDHAQSWQSAGDAFPAPLGNRCESSPSLGTGGVTPGPLE